MNQFVDLDNAAFRPELVAAFRACSVQPVAWEKAGPTEAALFQDHDELIGLADAVVAVARDGARRYWILQNDWSGFPDPAEFVFVGFADGGEVFALGYFEDWPGGWSRPEGI